jgi:hypothetical protein
MIVLFALVIVGACVAASYRRLSVVAAPTLFDTAVLGEALRGDRGPERIGAVLEALRALPESSWEHELAVAMASEDAVRAAHVNAALSEFDYRLQRWSRVPRVAASISASACFLLASLALRAALVEVGEPDAADATETFGVAFEGPILHAIDVVALGLFGATACGAIQYRARGLAKGAAASVDQLVERLEGLAPSLRSRKDAVGSE